MKKELNLKYLIELKGITKESIFADLVKQNSFTLTSNLSKEAFNQKAQFISKKLFNKKTLPQLDKTLIKYPTALVSITKPVEPKVANNMDYVLKQNNFIYKNNLDKKLCLNHNNILNILNSRNNIFKSIYLAKKNGNL